MTDFDTTDNIQIDETQIEKATGYKYMEQTTVKETLTRNKTLKSIKAGEIVFGHCEEMFPNKHLAINLKRKVFNQSVFPTVKCGCQEWSLTKKERKIE